MYKMVYLGPNGALTIEVPLYRTVVHYDQMMSSLITEVTKWSTLHV